MSTKTIFMKKKQKIYSSDIRAEFRDSFDMLKKYKNLFRKKANEIKSKKIILRNPNLYKSFINSYAPYNYFKVPQEKNTYLIYYQGGPKIYTYVESEKLNNQMDTKEIIYLDKKSCGCFNKLYVPKLRRSLSNFDNYRVINRNNFNFKRPVSGYNNSFSDRKLNFQTKKRDWTPKPKRFNTKPGSNSNGLIKKIINDKNNYKNYSTNYENRVRINFEDNKIDNNTEIINRRNKYDTLLYALNRNINKKFHKTQIFDHCKPFLSEGL